MAGYTRWNYFIDKGLQTKYIVLTMAVLVLHTFLVLAAIFSPYIMILSLDYPPTAKVEAAKAFLLLHSTSWPVIGVIILLFGVMTIFISHRIAGPIFNIRREIRKISEGDLNVDIHLRKRDEFHDLAEELNTLAAGLRECIATLKENSALLDGHIKELEVEIANRTLNEADGQRIIREIRESRASLQSVLDRFLI